MKRMILLPNLFLFLLICSITSHVLGAESDGKITGKVYDRQSGQPVEYATVSVYNSNDSSLVTGIISNENGVFSIGGLDEGNYYAEIRFIGYAKEIIKNIQIPNKSARIDLGTISLAVDEKVLGEVEVVAQRHNIEYQIDKKVISVGQELTSASMSAVEVLENVPSIRVDIEGNVSLRGSTGFTVLIDGKPTVLDPSDVLRQTPASTIQNIEIITNPSVKYEPDGTGGIINIITKKNRTEGIQGMVNLNAGRFDQYGGDFLLNYRKRNINFFIGGDYGEYPFPGQSSGERRTINNDTLTVVETNGTSERTRYQNTWRMGMNWDITEKDNFSVEASVGENSSNNTSELEYITTTDQSDERLQELSLNEYERGSKYYSISGHYLHRFRKENHELRMQANYGHSKGNEFSVNFLLNENNDIVQGAHRTEGGPSGEWDIRVDYSKPFGEKDLLEVGLQVRLDDNTDKTGFNTYDVNSDEFVNLPEYRNEIKYANNIYSLFGMYRGYIENFGYQLGLRGEYTFRDIHSIETRERFTLEEFDYFPTLHFSYQFPGDNQVMASYSRRIDRPGSWYLEPFLSWSDMFNVSSGNPDLKNEYIGSYELGYVKTWEKSQFSIETYYRVKQNKIEQIRSVYDDGILLTTFENVGTDYSLGIEAMYSAPLAAWWELSLMGDLFDYRIKGTKNNVPFETTSLNWSKRLSNTFSLLETVRLQLDGQYNSPTVSSQGETLEYWAVNCALRTDFFDSKLSTTLQVRDVFATARRVSITEDTGLYNYQRWRSDAPFISLTVSYRINNFNANRERRGENNNMDEF